MNKKMTKKQIKERDEKIGLYNRLYDLAVGADGGYNPEDSAGDGIGIWATLACDDMARFISAVAFTFDLGSRAPQDADGNNQWGLAHATDPRYLDQWETLDKLTDYLYGVGVRAWPRK